MWTGRKDAGPFTVFAPSDNALAKVPHGTVENLRRPENCKTLINVLTYHVLPGSIRADMLDSRHGRVMMRCGQFAKVDGRHGAQIKRSATVVSASNSLIHVVDRLLLV